MDNGAELDDKSAASILLSLRHAKLNRKTAIELEAMKRYIREKSAANTPSSSLANQNTRKRNVAGGRNTPSSSLANQNTTKRKAADGRDDPSLEKAKQNLVAECSSTIRQKLSLLIESMDTNQLKQFVGYPRLPELPPFENIDNIIDVNKCSEPCQKVLTSTDLNKHQLRLNLKINRVEEFLLPMLNEGEDIGEGINVITYDEGWNEYNMRFKSWKKMFVLTTKGWKEFYDCNKLKEFDVVVVWMFRHKETQQICFAISYRRVPPEVRSLILPSSHN